MPKNVLVIDPVVNNRIQLTAVLEEAQYAVETVSSTGEYAKTSGFPDLVVLGLQSDQPVKTMNSLNALNLPSEVPVLCLDANPSPLRRLAILRAGARDVLPRKVSDRLLTARLRGLIREGDAQRECDRRRVTAASFGFAETAPEFAKPAQIACMGKLGALPHLQSILSSTLPHNVVSPTNDTVLRDEAGSALPDAYVIVSGPDCDPLDGLMPELRDRSHLRHSPVLVVYPKDRADIAAHALAMGANDIAMEDASGEELGMRIEAMLKRKRLEAALRRSTEQSYRLAATDPLTGLYNRRYAESYLGDMVVRQGEASSPFVLMIVDIDHFKSVNDTYGHPIGDQVICEVAHRLRDNLRACDLVSRHGGEEFLIILPDTNRDEAQFTAERLRRAIAETSIKTSNGDLVAVTVSIGVAAADTSSVRFTKAVRTGTTDAVSTEAMPASLGCVLDAADAALYRAKHAGRDRIEINDA